MIKKILKIITIIFILLFIIGYFLFVKYTATKSDKEVETLFSKSLVEVKLSEDKFKGFQYRKASVTKDTILPTIVFVHGTVGSLTNFTTYLADSLLQTKANMIAYDRIGYNYKDKNNSQESIAFEIEMLKDVVKDIPKNKLILVGYSYGGPIVLGFKEKIKKIILLAPAVYAKVEPIPWMLNFYKWKLTRWLVPNIWKQASKEKMSHKKDLQNFEKEWYKTPNEVLSIHGKNDWIVPYTNSLLLKNAFKENEFELVSIPEASHNLVWSHNQFIKQQLLTVLD